MDNGEVIPGLNDGWTFAGARLMEWASGFVMAVLVQEIFLSNPARTMPVFLGVLIMTTLGMAGLRNSFPDEDRGVRDYFMVLMGMSPPGIPSPANIQPVWSGNRLVKLDDKKEFVELGLLDVFPHDIDEEDEPLDYLGEERVH